MMINGSLPVLPLGQEQSSSLSLQQSSESGSGDFSALLFLIFASPISQPVATAADGQLAGMESSSTDNGALIEQIEENPGGTVQIVAPDLLQLPFGERASESSAPSKGVTLLRKGLSDLKSLASSGEDEAFSEQSQNNVIGPLGLMLPEQASATAAEKTADSPKPVGARLQGQLSALAHNSVASQVQEFGALPPLASDGQTPAAEPESALLSIEQTPPLPAQEQPSATQKMLASFLAPKEPNVDAALQSDAISAEPAADGKKDIVKKLLDGEKSQPARSMAVTQKMAELTYEKTSDSFKVVAAPNSEPSANDALPTVNVAAKNGGFVVSSSPAQAVIKPTQLKWSSEKLSENPQGETLTTNQKTEVASSATRDQNATFEFDGRGGRAPGDFFENSSAGSDISSPSSNFSAISLRATENGVAGDAKLDASWSPTIDHVAAEIAGNVRRNKHEAVITLDPPELGKLKIGLTVDGDKVQVRIFVEARESRGLIENHLPDLKQALVSHHLDLVDVRVDGGNWNGSGSGDLMHSFQHNSRGQQEAGWSAGNSPLSTSEVADAPTSDAVSEKGRVSIRA
jgi:flagellar hook-length control protein FliK